MPGPDDAGFCDLVASLYEASAAPDLWAQAAGRMADYCGSDAVQILQLHPGSPVDILSHAGGPGHSPGAEADYVRYYCRIDPRQELMRRSPGRLHLCHEVFSEDFVRRSEYYQDFSIPHGFRWVIVGELVSTPAAKLQVAFLRSTTRRHFGRQELTRAEQIVPHLARAARIGHRLLEAQCRAATTQAVLDSLPWAVAVVDRSLRVQAANGSAHLLMENGVLPLRRGRLSLVRPDAEARLRQLVSDAIETAERRGCRGGGALALDGGSGPDRRLLVSPIPPVAGAGLIGARSGDGCAMITVHEAGARCHPPAQALIDLYGLTRAEARVALELARGLRISDISSLGGASVNTLRSQVKAILSKTGCHGQAELLQMLAAMPVP